MPKARTRRTRYPAGWELVEPTLTELESKMRDAQLAPSSAANSRSEAMWPIFRLNHQRSRYIYDKYYRTREISRELYEWLIREKYADGALIAKWKKNGYEQLCCLRCIQTKSHAFGTACICRVPPAKMREGQVVECFNCGCRGCAGGGGGAADEDEVDKLVAASLAEAEARDAALLAAQAEADAAMAALSRSGAASGGSGAAESGAGAGAAGASSE